MCQLVRRRPNRSCSESFYTETKRLRSENKSKGDNCVVVCGYIRTALPIVNNVGMHSHCRIKAIIARVGND
jgi:hypothetical protein